MNKLKELNMDYITADWGTSNKVIVIYKQHKFLGEFEFPKEEHVLNRIMEFFDFKITAQQVDELSNDVVVVINANGNYNAKLVQDTYKDMKRFYDKENVLIFYLREDCLRKDHVLKCLKDVIGLYGAYGPSSSGCRTLSDSGRVIDEKEKETVVKDSYDNIIELVEKTICKRIGIEFNEEDSATSEFRAKFYKSFFTESLVRNIFFVKNHSCVNNLKKFNKRASNIIDKMSTANDTQICLRPTLKKNLIFTIDSKFRLMLDIVILVDLVRSIESGKVKDIGTKEDYQVFFICKNKNIADFINCIYDHNKLFDMKTYKNIKELIVNENLIVSKEVE